MPGKMTVLDRLISEGRITKSPFSVKKTSGEIRDPLNYPLNIRKDLDKLRDVANVQWVNMTPERVKYQQGIDARIAPRHEAAMQKRADAYDLKDQYEEEWREAVEEAKSDMADDWSSTLDYQDFDEVNPDILEDVELPSSNLRDYWPSSARDPDEIYEDFDAAQDAYYAAVDNERELFTPRYRMQEQTMTPRYRNYQRAMQQRAANMAMGRDLSRRYAIAYNSLLRRGLTPAEARMYMREYFGGR